MVDVPEAMPVTIPVTEPMVARVVVLLAQVPPVVAELRVAELPTQNALVPSMGKGTGDTLTVDIA